MQWMRDQSLIINHQTLINIATQSVTSYDLDHDYGTSVPFSAVSSVCL